MDDIRGRIDGYTFEVADALSGQRFWDNGDETVTDTQTGLIWEQKTFSGIHNRNNVYTWSVYMSDKPDGTAFTDFLGTLNRGTTQNGVATTGCFADHCDWRLPTITELAGIADATYCSSGFCLDPIFSPVGTLAYWSGTTDASAYTHAWFVHFGDALGTAGVNVDHVGKTNTFSVRAVRGGLPDGLDLCPADGSPGACNQWASNQTCNDCLDNAAGGGPYHACADASYIYFCNNPTVNAECASVIVAAGCAYQCQCP